MNKNNKLGSYLEEKIAKFNQKPDEKLTPEEIANFVELSNREVYKLLELPVGVETYSIDEFPEILEGEFLANEKDQPDLQLEQAEIIDYLAEILIKELKIPNNRAELYSKIKVIALRYGIGQDKEYSITEIAEKLGYKEYQVKQFLRIIKYYLRKLKPNF